MKLTLSRDPYTLFNRLQNAVTDEDFFNINWDDTQLDMYEEEDNIIVKLKAPGFDDKSIDISIEDNTLTITGTAEEREEETDKKKKYFRREIRTASFAKSVGLPARVVAEKAEAKFKDGILTLTLPKAEEAKPKKIKINVA